MENKKFKKEIDWLLKEKYNGELTKAAKIDIKRLKKDEPVDYLIGFVEFLSCIIELSQRPLIPRPETEYWTAKAIESMRINRNKNICCLDIFSGSGCVGIAVLKNIKQVKVDFCDIDKRFLKQIKINLKLNKINKRRYKVIQSDIFQNIKRKYDYILANPPYIAREKINKVQKSVLNFEPKKSLLGKKNGLFYIRKFLKNAKRYLTKKGKIYMEFDSFQRKEIIRILNKLNYSNYKIYKDQYGKWRYLSVE